MPNKFQPDKSQSNKSQTNKSQSDRSQSAGRSQAADKSQSAQSGKSQRDIGMIEVQKYIKDIDFPVGKNELLDHARSHDAPDEILELMKNFPSQQYGSSSDVSRALEQRKH